MFDFYIVLVLESTIWEGCRLVSLDYLGRKPYQPKLELGLGLSLAKTPSPPNFISATSSLHFVLIVI